MSAEGKDRQPTGEETLAFLSQQLGLPGVATSPDELIAMLPPTSDKSAGHLSDQEAESCLRTVRVLAYATHAELQGNEVVDALSAFVVAASEIPSYQGTIVAEQLRQPRLSIYSMLDEADDFQIEDVIAAAQHARHGFDLSTPEQRAALHDRIMHSLGTKLPSIAFGTPQIVTRGSGLDLARRNPEGYIAGLNLIRLGEEQPERFLGLLLPLH